MKNLFTIFIISLLFTSSCVSAYVLKSAKCCPKPIKDKKVILNSAFIDTANNLTINFFAKPARKKKTEYNITVNLDSINDTIGKNNLPYYYINGFSDIMFATTHDLKKNIDYDTYLEQNDFFIMIKRSDLTENQKNIPSNACMVEISDYKYRFGLERKKINLAKYLYLLLPFAIVFDAFTFPLQIIFFYIIIANIEI